MSTHVRELIVVPEVHDAEVADWIDVRTNPGLVTEKYYRTISQSVRLRAAVLIAGALVIGPSDAMFTGAYPGQSFVWHWAWWPSDYGPVTLVPLAGSSSIVDFNLPDDVRIGQWAIRCDWIITATAQVLRCQILPLSVGEGGI